MTALAKKHRADDIRHKDRVTDEQIADYPPELVYSWLRNGDWKQKDFMKWLRILRVVE